MLIQFCRDHITELNSARPKQPFFFLKPASSILPPGAGPVIRPRGVDLHYEVELALVMGKTVKDLEASDMKGALDSIESTSLLLNCDSRISAIKSSWKNRTDLDLQAMP